MARFLIVVAALLLASSAAFASQTLTIDLETPSINNSPVASSAPAPKPAQAPKPQKSTTVKIGRVGMVASETATIYQFRSSNSRVYAKVQAEMPLAITDERDSIWLGVLMANGATGWVKRDFVKLIGYELVAKKSDVERASASSRGANGSRDALPDSDIIRTAMQYAGVPYVYGGTSPVSGMDCSAFVRSVFNQYGVRLPRTAREQAQVGSDVPITQLQPGDRLYFACKNPYPDHCGIYAGNGYFIHCSSSKRGVAIDSLASDFYYRSLVAARRS